METGILIYCNTEKLSENDSWWKSGVIHSSYWNFWRINVLKDTIAHIQLFELNHWGSDIFACSIQLHFYCVDMFLPYFQVYPSLLCKPAMLKALLKIESIVSFPLALLCPFPSDLIGILNELLEQWADSLISINFCLEKTLRMLLIWNLPLAETSCCCPGKRRKSIYAWERGTYWGASCEPCSTDHAQRPVHGPFLSFQRE